MNELPGNTKIGLEVHMQLNVGKLFCKCGSEGEAEKMGFTRKLHSSSGESGSQDISSVFEESRNRTFKYIIYSNSCLIEADEQPPTQINDRALKATLSMAMAFHSSILERISVMRKVVIDGSNTSGFQRTSLIAMGGTIKGDLAEAGITAISLEEDSCRKIEEEGNMVVYSLDRLGIPLIEISTSPDMKTAEEAISIAKEIGNRLRVMGLLKKGADAIRQDVNFSMGYGRVEIKGVSKLSAIRDILLNESERQQKLSEAMEAVMKRGGTEKLDFKDISSMFLGSNSKMIRKGLEEGKLIYATILKNFKGLLKANGYRVGREIADALKQVGIKGVIHYDELPAYGITVGDRDEISERMELKENDSFLMLILGRDELDIARFTIEERIRKLLSMDFSETRAVLEDNSTRYMRPLSGSSRMYPETDIPIIKVHEDLLQEASRNSPGSMEETIGRISEEYGISGQDAETIINDQKVMYLRELANKHNGKMISRLITQTVPEMEKKYGREMEWNTIVGIIKYCTENSLGRYSMEKGLHMLFSGIPMNEILSHKKLMPLSEDEIRKMMKTRGIDKNEGMSRTMDILTSSTEGVIDPSIVARLINTKKNKDSN